MSTDATQKAEKQQRMWNAIRKCQTVYVFITTRLSESETLDCRSFKAFRYGKAPDRVGLVRENTCPSGNTSLQRFCTTRYRESPIPCLIFGNGFYDEETGARVELLWPDSIGEPEPLYFEGQLLDCGDNHGRFVSLNEARTKSEFHKFTFVHKGMKLRELLEVTDCDGRLPCWLLPEGARVFPPMVELYASDLENVRSIFPNRLLIRYGYTKRGTVSIVPVELPLGWTPSASDAQRVRPVSSRLFDVLEIVEDRPLFMGESDEAEREMEEEEAANALAEKNGAGEIHRNGTGAPSTAAVGASS